VSIPRGGLVSISQGGNAYCGRRTQYLLSSRAYDGGMGLRTRTRVSWGVHVSIPQVGLVIL
jgi:hypothetical protein